MLDVTHWVHHWWPSVIRTLDHRQTLLTGFLALVGAGGTVWGIRWQIAQARTEDETSRRREEDAAKAVLPLALTEIVQYAQDSLRIIDEYTSGSTSDGPLDAPRLPQDAIGNLQACARHADENVTSQISGLLSALQVQHARFRGFVQRRTSMSKGSPEVSQAILDAADLYARTEALFEYSREGYQGTRASADQIRNALRVNHIDEEDYRGLEQLINMLFRTAGKDKE